jgi:bifunctional non-homologous end joining protein LigD
MPDLRRYREKRDPDRTPEPFGDKTERLPLAPGAPRIFVVQQHAARRMHWDLRLEIEGVLASWAVPKGPSLDPKERRLAVRTEDHPLEYADFEGTIPPGNYGAGTMIVWDRGVYHTAGESSPAEGLERGKLDLVLHGHKLLGRFALVRTRGEGGRNWLLLSKGRAAEGAPEIVQAEPASVLSGLTVAELGDGVSRTEEIARRAAKAGAPRGSPTEGSLRPMLAGTAEEPFSREGWLFELKYDGVRVLVSKRPDGSARILSRTGADVTAKYPEVARAARHLPIDEAVIDGEVVAQDASGRSSFERLQRRFTQSDRAAIARAEVEIPVLLYAFDLPFAAGYDVRRCPLRARKEMLALLSPRKGVVRFADHIEGDGEALWEAARERGLEGIIAKRADSPYETGARSRAWLKIKIPRTADLAIVGALPGKGSRKRLGSLMLAWRDGRGLLYAGNVGSGLDEETLEELHRRLEAARTDEPAFAGAPERFPRGALFARPEIVCEVRFTEVTSAGLLRQPVFLRLREDKRVADCDAPPPREELRGPEAGAERPEARAPRARPAAARPERPLELTRLEKVFWPIEGFTKGDLLAYYESVWPWLAPYLQDRPLVLTRYPDGIEGKHFYQKNAPEFTPDWIERERIDDTDYFLCNDVRSLLYVINSGAIPLHVWSARRFALERPDWLILDLDPKEAPFGDVIEVARFIHRLLGELEAPHFVKTSGQDGLHVLLPLGARLEHADARTLSEVLARVVCATLPEIATITRPVAARGDKVYVDYLQNGYGKLIASPFSVRPRPGAPVSTPLAWAEVKKGLDPRRWNIRTVLRRLSRAGDPMLGVLGEPVDVDALLRALEHRLAAVA